MLRTRVITALVLLAVFFAALFWLPPIGWVGFVALIVGLAAWEWAGMTRYTGSGRSAYAVGLALACVALALLAFKARVDAPVQVDAGVLRFLYFVAAGFWLLLVPLWLVRRWRITDRLRAGFVGLVVLLPAGLAMVQLRILGPLVLLAAMAGVWVADIAAYFVGRRFGRRKLAPAISPGKTWEGAAGAALGVLIYGLVVAAFHGRLLPEGASGLALFALWLIVLTGVSIVGDLFESLMKRQAGVKDSSGLLPGHGGLLDRIDSLTSTLPMVGIFMLLWRT